MSDEAENKSLLNLDVRCVACFSIGRNLRPMKEAMLMSKICPGLKFTDNAMICWECGHIIEKIKAFKARIIKTQSLLNTISENMQSHDIKTLSSLKTTDTSIVSILEDESNSEANQPALSQRIKFEDSDSDWAEDTCDNSNDNWSNTEDSCASSVKYSQQTPMKRPDNTKTSQWLQQEKLNVPKIVGNNTMTLKELLDQPLQYPAGKYQDEKSVKDGTLDKDDDESTVWSGGQCTMCSFRFNDQNTYVQHMKWHSINPGFKSATPSTTSHPPIQPSYMDLTPMTSWEFSCQLCDLKFTCKLSYDNHYVAIHQEEKYKEFKKQRNRERQRAFYYRQKNKKKEEKNKNESPENKC
ncbi:uncharacterized protein LOC113509006 isoform X2 [Trichoplusia ni]|uniref:Uncharacterized protein LOC113509006 isoform X2 n=1 Tax=Trichoplusia ni TaxID=7111 RepID=A0A7E5X629_TRINI|nr:uncharacterized protein LOC113509006 isoform X2 [Trichoplusia ni]